jgi:hypothetical protein
VLIDGYKVPFERMHPKFRDKYITIYKMVLKQQSNT